MAETILIIDDDVDLCDVLRVALAASGYRAVTAPGGAEGLRLLREHQPDLVLLDVMMPDMDGWETCERIRAISTVPIIFLTARESEQEKVKGLDLGADDYIGKPFRQSELRARVNAALRRAHQFSPHKEPLLCCGDGDLIINTATRTVIVRGGEIELTPTEYNLLLYLVKHAGRVLTAKQISDAIWGTETNVGVTSINSYIWRLRGKIERDPARPRFILTESNVGYRFVTG